MNALVAIEAKQEQGQDSSYARYLLDRHGFHCIVGRDLRNELQLGGAELSVFQNFWGNLPVDEFMADGGRYRLRRFGVFHYDARTSALEYKGNQAFYQDKTVNGLNGGVPRLFGELEPRFVCSRTLESIIRSDIELLPARLRFSKVKVYIHQIRIVAHDGFTGQPTPEGIHQDGHMYVAQHLIARENVIGGESAVYDLDKKPLFETVLRKPLDTLVVKDPAVFHSVTPVVCAQGSGYRDMLLIDFNEL